MGKKDTSGNPDIGKPGKRLVQMTIFDILDNYESDIRESAGIRDESIEI